LLGRLAGMGDGKIRKKKKRIKIIGPLLRLLAWSGIGSAIFINWTGPPKAGDYFDAGLDWRRSGKNT